MTAFRSPLRVLAEGENELTAAPSGSILGNLTGNITGGITGGATAAEINRAADVSTRLVAAGATLTVTEALHDGKTILLDQAAGCTVTLPAATGSGAKYRFLQSVVPTSNSNIVKVANGTDVMRGFAMTLQDGGDTSVFFETASTSDTITLNRTTTGGTQIGELIEVEDILAGFFAVRVFNIATGTEATPFSATV
jgi:hypothetical protein